MTPRLYQSVASESGRAEPCSGDMYAGVPTTEMLRFDPETERSVTIPKSSRITRPSRDTRTLDGLMSR